MNCFMILQIFCLLRDPEQVAMDKLAELAYKKLLVSINRSYHSYIHLHSIVVRESLSQYHTFLYCLFIIEFMIRKDLPIVIIEILEDYIYVEDAATCVPAIVKIESAFGYFHYETLISRREWLSLAMKSGFKRTSLSRESNTQVV